MYWLNENASAIQALSSVAIVLVTFALVSITWKYVLATRELVRLQIEPIVECAADTSSEGRHLFLLQNLGVEAVLNVRVNIRHYILRIQLGHQSRGSEK